MIKALSIAIMAVFMLSACTSTTQQPDDGTFRPTIFRIPKSATNKIQFRQLDTINEIRGVGGLPLLQLSEQLNAAAKTHSIDMANQQRPWHFGSDGSSPIDRVARTGYTGRMLGENISETYENDTETLQAWMNDPDARASILDPAARYLGFAWFQESNGKIWWTQLTGS
ncbi:MAG: CAP domain-containing protein [Proteobacteria bacterium]|nr:CAP domain-containing protein [Pseudomonadota bacterium]